MRKHKAAPNRSRPVVHDTEMPATKPRLWAKPATIKVKNDTVATVSA